MNDTQLPAFKLIGIKLQKKTINEGGRSNTDCGNLWTKFETENYLNQIPNKINNDIYAVYFNYDGDHTKAFSYFIGCRTGNEVKAPEGMKSLLIPGQNYSKLLAKGVMPNCITDSWKEVWTANLNRTYQFDFEVHDNRSKDWSNAEVNISVAIV